MEKDKNLLEPKLLDTKSLMQYLGIGENAARKLIKNPKSTYTIRIGQRYLVNKSALDKYIDQHTGLNGRCI